MSSRSWFEQQRINQLNQQYNHLLSLQRYAKSLWISTACRYFSTTICVRTSPDFIPRPGWENGVCSSFDTSMDEDGRPRSRERRLFKRTTQLLGTLKANIDAENYFAAEFAVQMVDQAVDALRDAVSEVAFAVNDYIGAVGTELEAATFADDAEREEAVRLGELWRALVLEAS